MLAVSLISYLDRNTLAILAPTILRETGLSGAQYGRQSQVDAAELDSALDRVAAAVRQLHVAALWPVMKMNEMRKSAMSRGAAVWSR